MPYLPPHNNLSVHTRRLSAWEGYERNHLRQALGLGYDVENTPEISAREGYERNHLRQALGLGYDVENHTPEISLR
jgi:hypothetical protein